MPKQMIRTRELVYNYTKNDEDGNQEVFPALKNINLNISDGDFIAVLGHNGSGKSTLAKHMNALLTPYSGEIWVNGYDTKTEEFLWEIRQSAGMVFQNPDNQIIATTVEDDVAFGPENLGVAPAEIRQRVEDSIKTVGMKEYMNHSPHFLSGGQKQRVAIAGILAMRPKCIIFDEPTAMLDPIGRREVMETALKLNKEEKITIVLITHFMEEAVLADKVFVMEDGEIAASGTPSEIFSQVEYVKSLGLDVPQVTETANLLNKMGMPIPVVLNVEDMLTELEGLLRKSN